MNDREYRFLALYIFLRANRLMLLRDAGEISRNVSERSFCANLKEFMNIVINQIGLEGYIADVEYNRGGQLIKAIHTENEEKPIQCDLIIHSRGRLKDDNLLCVEVKKKGNNYRVNEDIERLIELTKPNLNYKTSFNHNDNYYCVNGYKLGIFYIYDHMQRTIELGFYANGRLLCEAIFTFDEILNSDYVLNIDGINLSISESQRSITFYNMGFGDSFLIRDGSHRLLVDCGSLNVDKTIWNANKSNILINTLISSNTDLLITHYHADHLNYIKELSDSGLRFKNIYVRNINDRNFEFDIYNFFFELVTYSYLTSDYNTLLFWLDPKLLFRLLKRGGKIIGVNNVFNNKFTIGGSTADVLWPEPKMPLPVIDYDDLLSGYPVSLRHLQRLVELYNDIANNYSGDPLIVLEEKYRSSDLFTEEIQNMIISEILRMSEDPKVKPVMSKLPDLENKLSIVFAIENKLLMCGDATKSSLRKALKSKENVEYSIIKVPHHGTSAYCLSKIYNSTSIFLIPNSKICRKMYIDDRYCASKRCECLNSSTASSCVSCCHKKKRMSNCKTFIF